jgi:hypothetical protein
MSLSIKKNKISLKLEFESALISELLLGHIESDREEILIRALGVGLLAEKHNDLSTFLDLAEKELGAKTAKLSELYRIRNIELESSQKAGDIAEKSIGDVVEGYLKKIGSKNYLDDTGNTVGLIEGNKTGDFVIYSEANDPLIGIEVKFDSSVAIGEIKNKDPKAKKDTALGQLAETSANRGTEENIIVFDKSKANKALLAEISSGLKYYQNFGFICAIDSEKGDFSTLLISLDLASQIILSVRKSKLFDTQIVNALIEKLLRWLKNIDTIKNQLSTMQTSLNKITGTLESNEEELSYISEKLKTYINADKVSNDELLKLYNNK